MKGLIRYIRIKTFTLMLWAFALLVMLTSCGAKKRAVAEMHEETHAAKVQTQEQATDSATTQAALQTVDSSESYARIEIERYAKDSISAPFLRERIIMNIDNKRKTESSELVKAQELHLLTRTQYSEEEATDKQQKTETRKEKDPFPWWWIVICGGSIVVALRIRKHLMDML